MKEKNDILISFIVIYHILDISINFPYGKIFFLHYESAFRFCKGSFQFQGSIFLSILKQAFPLLLMFYYHRKQLLGDRLEISGFFVQFHFSLCESLICCLDSTSNSSTLLVSIMLIISEYKNSCHGFRPQLVPLASPAGKL